MYILMSLTIRDILRKKLESIEEMTSVQEAAKKMVQDVVAQQIAAANKMTKNAGSPDSNPYSSFGRLY